MHRVAYVHRDIKLENLLFAGENCEPETLRIADFGFARKMTSSRSTLSEQCGTPGYVAPEIITGQCYTPAVDCWAAGVVLYAAVVGRFPFDAGEDTQASFRMIAEGRVHEIPASSGVSDDAKDLIARLLTVDPVTRFTAEEALGHPWIVKHTSSANDGGDGGGADGYARAVVAPGQRMRRAMQSKLGSDLKLREYPPGAYLTRLGERAKASNEEVYLIKGGVVEVLTRDDDTRDERRCAPRGADGPEPGHAPSFPRALRAPERRWRRVRVRAAGQPAGPQRAVQARGGVRAGADAGHGRRRDAQGDAAR